MLELQNKEYSRNLVKTVCSHPVRGDLLASLSCLKKPLRCASLSSEGQTIQRSCSSSSIGSSFSDINREIMSCGVIIKSLLEGILLL